jgi:3-(3-hydroxy-phenyl)propionate hydroxylase
MMRDVLIVGAGPVGLTLAHLLARHGLRVTLLERGHAPQARLGAVSVDDECLRIWQACGLGPDLAQAWASGEPGRVVCRYHDAVGREFLRLRQRRSDLGHPHAVVLDHDLASGILWQKAIEHPGIDLVAEAAFESLAQRDNGVDVSASVGGATQSFKARWVVACDGAGSAVRQHLGIAMPTEDLPQPWLVANITDASEDRCVRITCAPAAASVSVPLPGQRRRIEMMLSPEQASEIDATAAMSHLRRVWPAAAHAELIDFAIMRFRAGVAERWRLGRVFLAGDAAHVTPPFASQGLATGLRDASNLAFKLAGVTQGWLPESALDTYEAERRPHQQRMIRLALRLGWLMSPTHRPTGALAHKAIGVLARVPALRGRFEMRGPDLRPVYDSTLVGSGRHAGRYLPQPRVLLSNGRAIALDALLGPRMTWLQLGREGRPGEVGNPPLSLGDVLLVEGRDFIDRERTLQRRFGQGALVLVRPDRIVHSHTSLAPSRAWRSRRTPWDSRPEPLPAS